MVSTKSSVMSCVFLFYSNTGLDRGPNVPDAWNGENALTAMTRYLNMRIVKQRKLQVTVNANRQTAKAAGYCECKSSNSESCRLL
jgi:hypothetical protein